MVGLHRIGKGYHSFFDRQCADFTPDSIGLMSWNILDTCKKEMDVHNDNNQPFQKIFLGFILNTKN